MSSLVYLNERGRMRQPSYSFWPYFGDPASSPFIGNGSTVAANDVGPKRGRSRRFIIRRHLNNIVHVPPVSLYSLDYIHTQLLRAMF